MWFSVRFVLLDKSLVYTNPKFEVVVRVYFSWQLWIDESGMSKQNVSLPVSLHHLPLNHDISFIPKYKNYKKRKFVTCVFIIRFSVSKQSNVDPPLRK